MFAPGLLQAGQQGAVGSHFPSSPHPSPFPSSLGACAPAAIACHCGTIGPASSWQRGRPAWLGGRGEAAAGCGAGAAGGPRGFPAPGTMPACAPPGRAGTAPSQKPRRLARVPSKLRAPPTQCFRKIPKACPPPRTRRCRWSPQDSKLQPARAMVPGVDVGLPPSFATEPTKSLRPGVAGLRSQRARTREPRGFSALQSSPNSWFPAALKGRLPLVPLGNASVSQRDPHPSEEEER